MAFVTSAGATCPSWTVRNAAFTPNGSRNGWYFLISFGPMISQSYPECRLHPEWIEERVVFLDLVRADDFAVISGKPRDSIDVVEPVDLFVGNCETQTAASMPGDGLPRQFLELRVKPGAIDMHPRQVE